MISRIVSLLLISGCLTVCPAVHAFFYDNRDGTISDTETGLMWQKYESASMSWANVTYHLEQLNWGKYNDWRLPTGDEMLGIKAYILTFPEILNKTGLAFWFAQQVGRGGPVGMSFDFIWNPGYLTINYPFMTSANVLAVRSNSGPSLRQYSLSLRAGWNLVSIPLLAPKTHPSVVLTSFADKVSAVWEYDGSWRYYAPGHPGSTLTDLIPGRGYWIKVTEPCTLTIQGTVP